MKVMKNEHQGEHEKNMRMIKEVSELLPETNDKIDHYKEALRAESALLKKLEKRQKSWFLRRLSKVREKMEIVNIKNSLVMKQKVFENYLKRKNRYEKWLDEMTMEVQSNFDSTLSKAKEIKNNVRLGSSIQSYEERNDIPTIVEQVQFYLYMKQELKNHKKYGKKK